MEPNVKEIVFALKKLKEVKSIAFHGSHGYSKGDKYSDVDIVCFCTKIPQIKKREKTLSPIVSELNTDKNKPKEYFKIRDYFYHKNQEMAVDYLEIKKMEKLLDKFSKRKASVPEIQEFLNYIYYTKSIYDSDKVLKNLKKRVPKPNKDLARRILFFIESRILSGMDAQIKRKNYLEINRRFDEGIKTYLVSLYMANGTYFSHYKNAFVTIKNLKKKPKNCREKLQKVAKMGNSEKEVKEKIKIFDSLYRYLLKIL